MSLRDCIGRTRGGAGRGPEEKDPARGPAWHRAGVPLEVTYMKAGGNYDEENLCCECGAELEDPANPLCHECSEFQEFLSMFSDEEVEQMGRDIREWVHQDCPVSRTRRT